MKRLLVVPAVLLAAVVLPVTVGAPAFAKGATDVVVSGPGIDEVSLGWTRRPGDVDVGSLAEASGVYLILGAAQVAERPDLTAVELGPRYRLTWYQGSSVMVVTYAYPFAEGGAWAHVPDEPGGWVRGGPDLRRAMLALGATAPAADVTRDVAAGPDEKAGASGTTGASAPAESPPPPGASSPLLVVSAAALALVLAATAWLARRRRTPQPA